MSASISNLSQLLVDFDRDL